MSNLKHRAMAAYFRSANKQLEELGGAGSVIQPSVDEVEHEGLRYIVMSNTNGTLAVYRVRIVNGQEVLKGLKRWPAALNG